MHYIGEAGVGGEVSRATRNTLGFGPAHTHTQTANLPGIKLVI